MSKFSDYLSSVGEIGYVEEVSQSLAQVTGLPGLKPGEIVFFEDDSSGQAMDIDENLAKILIFSKSPPRVGLKATRTNEQIMVSLSDDLRGRTLNAFGIPLGEGKPLSGVDDKRGLETPPPGISTREKIATPLETGTIIVDMMIPLGKGQRELVIGDRKTGKSSFLRRTVVAQAKEGAVCIYALIGKKASDIKDMESYFQNSPVKNNVILVISTSQEPASVINLTPYTAMTIAEYFRDKGIDSLVVLDDLSTHAKFYRETSLLAKRFPGRDSYPGDIFFIHSRLLERAGNFKSKKPGGSSISCLPIVETVEGDLTGYIPTNIMSMTDGHIFFDGNLFSKGRRPAINHTVSVTRVGRQTQTQLKKDINRELSSLLSLYERSEEFSHFSAGLSESVKFALQTGERVIKFFDQHADDLVSENAQIFLFSLLWRGFWQNKTTDQMKQDLERLNESYKSDQKISEYINNSISESKTFNDLLKKVDDQKAQILTLFNLTQ